MCACACARVGVGVRVCFHLHQATRCANAVTHTPSLPRADALHAQIAGAVFPPHGAPIADQRLDAATFIRDMVRPDAGA